MRTNRISLEMIDRINMITRMKIRNKEAINKIKNMTIRMKVKAMKVSTNNTMRMEEMMIYRIKTSRMKTEMRYNLDPKNQTKVF